MLHVVRRLLNDVRRRQAEEAEQLLRLSEEAREAGRQPRPLGRVLVASGGERRRDPRRATMRPPSASRWQ